MSEIILEDVSKQFNGDYIFRNINLEIKKNEMVALIGESGCGKTTLLNLIGMLDSDYSGSIMVQGKDIKFENRTKFFRNKLGYLFQNFALIDNITVSENLDISLKFTDTSDKENAKLNALSKVNLRNKLNKKIYTLSGGEQQRVSIARLLLKQCEIILADEPTGSLDKDNKLFILKLLKDLQKTGKTIVIVTHDKEVSDFCDRSIDLNFLKPKMNHN